MIYWPNEQERRDLANHFYSGYQAVDVSPGAHMGFETFAHLVENGNLMVGEVWNVQPDDLPRLVGTFGFQLYEKPTKHVHVGYVAGRGMLRYLDELTEAAERVRQHWGGAYVLVEGRKGWQRALARFQARYGDKMRIETNG